MHNTQKGYNVEGPWEKFEIRDFVLTLGLSQVKGQMILFDII